MATYDQPKDGITAKTPKKVLFGAGTVHKGLTQTGGKWNFAESLWFATGDGNKLTITPEITSLEIDGAWVKVEDMDVKTGETAQMAFTPVELGHDVLKAAVLGEKGTSKATGFDVIESKEGLTAGDYVENLAYVGTYLDGSPVIVVFDKAICTSGMELEGASKEKSAPEITFDCVAPLDGSHRKLPWHIYTPSDAMSVAETRAAKKGE